MATATDTLTVAVDKDQTWYSLTPNPDEGDTQVVKKISKSSMAANQHRLFYGFQINGWDQANILVTAAALKDAEDAKVGGNADPDFGVYGVASSASVSSAGEEDDEEEEDEEEDA
jgi:hypothetical protein